MTKTHSKSTQKDSPPPRTNRDVATGSRKKGHATVRTASASNAISQDPIAALSARVAALEAVAAPLNASATQSAAKLTAGDDRYWALNELNRQRIEKPADRGAVLYAGTVELSSGAQYVWQRQDSTRALTEQNWHDLADTLAALGHPLRLSILKHALGQDRSTQDFMALPDMGTTGQLFHHIKTLQDTGWLRSVQRGLYGVPGERVVPLLAILTATRG